MCSATRWEGNVDVKAAGARRAALPQVVTGTPPHPPTPRELCASVLQDGAPEGRR